MNVTVTFAKASYRLSSFRTVSTGLHRDQLKTVHLSLALDRDRVPTQDYFMELNEYFLENFYLYY